MKSAKPWIVYSIIRLGIFAVVLAALLFFQVNPFVSAIAAAIIALCVSYIFLGRQRNEVAKDIYERRHSEQRDVDNDIENAMLDDIEAAGEPAQEATGVRDSEGSSGTVGSSGSGGSVGSGGGESRQA